MAQVRIPDDLASALRRAGKRAGRMSLAAEVEHRLRASLQADHPPDPRPVPLPSEARGVAVAAPSPPPWPPDPYRRLG